MKKVTEKHAKRTKHIKFFLENLFSLKSLLRFVFYNIFVAAIGHTFYYAREIFTDENPYGIPSFLYAQISCAIVMALAIVVSTYIGTYHIEAKGGSVTNKGTIHSKGQLKGNNEMLIFFHKAGHAVMAYLQGCDTVSIDTTNKCVTTSSFPCLADAPMFIELRERTNNFPFGENQGGWGSSFDKLRSRAHRVDILTDADDDYIDGVHDDLPF